MLLSRRVAYILGAGVNRSVHDLESVPPPVAGDFFPTLLNTQIGARIWSWGSSLAPYIARYWHKDQDALAQDGLDLEELFTFLEYHRLRGAPEEMAEVVNAEFEAKSMFAQYMAHFEDFADESLRQFARLLKRQAAGVLTFNYDCILERAMESVSDSINHPDNASGFSVYSWNRSLAYGLHFDEIELKARIEPKWVGKDYYTTRALYEPPLLKLHGSVSWHRYLPVHSSLRGNATPPFPGHLAARLLLLHNRSPSRAPIFRNGWMLDPVLITPALFKEQYYRQPVFQRLWAMAEATLRSCEDLVVVGYSFPPTDFNIRNLLRLVFGTHTLASLTGVNPIDEAEGRAQALTSFAGHVDRYSTLNDYVSAVHA